MAGAGQGGLRQVPIPVARPIDLSCFPRGQQLENWIREAMPSRPVAFPFRLVLEHPIIVVPLRQRAGRGLVQDDLAARVQLQC
jgi:hypothetical protein